MIGKGIVEREGEEVEKRMKGVSVEIVKDENVEEVNIESLKERFEREGID